jgi:hypothetical protein
MLSFRSDDEVGALQRRDPRGARTSERSNQTTLYTGPGIRSRVD